MGLRETLNNNLEQAKETALFYRAEIEGTLSKNVKKVNTFRLTWKSRFLAVFWLYLLFLSIPVCSGLAVGLWIASWWQDKSQVTKVNSGQRRTILITGASTSKALFLSRVFGQAGHKIIMVANKELADEFSMTRFSRYVNKFINLSHVRDSDYVEALMKIWDSENVDWFIPLNTGSLYLMETEAKGKMEQLSNIEGRNFVSLALNSAQAEELQDVHHFLVECQDAGINVPEFKKLSDVLPLSDLTMFRNQGLFQDPRKKFVLSSMPNVQIPQSEANFHAFLDEFSMRGGTDRPNLMMELVQGQAFVCNAICADGKLIISQILWPSSPSIVSHPWNLVEPGIEKWVESFVRAKNLTGMLSFDVIVDQDNHEVFGLACRPYLHSAIVSFNDKSQMSQLEKTLRMALEPTPHQDKEVMLPLRPEPNKESFWLFHELENLLFMRRSLDSVLDTMQHGKDAIWSPDDPLPFFALHYLQIPILFGQAIFNGQIWNKVDFRMDKDFLSYQD